MRFMEWIQWTGMILHGSIYIWLVMKKSSVFNEQRSTSFLLLYCVFRAIWPIVRVGKFVDENTYTFDRWSCARRSFSKVPKTSGQIITTRSWLKFVLMQDSWQLLKSDSTSWQRHWRVLTIYRTSGMSWVHFAKRWKIICSKRSDSKEFKIGPVLEVTTSYLQGKYGVEIRIESVNKDNSHSWVRISFSWIE